MKDGRTDGQTDGRTDGQTTQNNAPTDARLDGLTDDLIENNSMNIIQPDTQQPHDDTTGTKRSDGKKHLRGLEGVRALCFTKEDSGTFT